MPRSFALTAALAALLLTAGPAAAQTQAPTETTPPATAPPAATTPAPAPTPTPAAPSDAGKVPTPAPTTGLVPKERALYKDGPSGRFLLDGPWLFRLDDAKQGLSRRFQRQTGTAGWSRVAVPNAWNAGDDSDKSFAGSVGWYRKDFTLPSAAAALRWKLRFESVNYRTRAWINGVPIGTNRGAYLPFELRLPVSALRTTGVNRLVVRVENVRTASDFPPAGLSASGTATGGWWNYGGLLREVYLERLDRVEWSTVQVRPELACAACAANVQVRVTVRNPSASAVRTEVTGRFGTETLDLGVKAVGAGRFATFTTTLRIAQPRLWSPSAPNLYAVDLTARAGGSERRKGKTKAKKGTVVARYHLSSGIRSIKVVDGRLLLNGKPLNFRGVGLHEDDGQKGFAIDNGIRDRELAEAKELGATVLRSHYPLHPYTQERADELGIMLWSEIPVYALKTRELAKLEVRKLAANELRDNILNNQNHPSILVWSVGNELSSRPGPVQGYYLSRAARTAKELDPTRPVGYAFAGYPSAGCQSEYEPLDIIGVNEYFGWYPGPNGQLADRTSLSSYLDSVRACYPDKAIVVTETGAESNRDGPVEEKGTFAFQDDFISYHFGVYATKPWLSGAIWWGLEEFRVRPGWDGGNPRPDPPIHQKGLITFDGRRKSAFTLLQRLYRETNQGG